MDATPAILIALLLFVIPSNLTGSSGKGGRPASHGVAKGLCKENKFPKIRDYYGSGWVVSRSHLDFFGKSSQNTPKPLLIF